MSVKQDTREKTRAKNIPEKRQNKEGIYYGLVERYYETYPIKLNILNGKYYLKYKIFTAKHII
jgi:hypothetical protein